MRETIDNLVNEVDDLMKNVQKNNNDDYNNTVNIVIMMKQHLCQKHRQNINTVQSKNIQLQNLNLS